MKKALKSHERSERKSQSARKTTNYMGADATVYDEIDPAMTTKFVGYDSLQSSIDHSADNRDRSC